ncbi:hypothetical protein D6833_12470, partial [Candidatus Parcubacteria bacterium]
SRKTAPSIDWEEAPLFQGNHFFIMAKRFQNVNMPFSAWLSATLSLFHRFQNPYLHFWLGKFYYGKLEKALKRPFNLPLNTTEVILKALLSYSKAIDWLPELGYVIYPQIQNLQKFLEINPEANLVFAGNKHDLLADGKEIEARLQEMAARYHAPALLTSAKTGQNVEALFQTLAEKLLDCHKNG